MWLDVPRLLSFVRELMSGEEMKVSGWRKGMEKRRGMKRKMAGTGKNFEKKWMSDYPCFVAGLL